VTIHPYKIYQSSDGDWIVFDGTEKNFFSTEEEAQDMASKLTFATQAQTSATSLSDVSDKLADLYSVYFDRGYNSGGSNPITNDDVASLGITAAQLGDMMTLAQQFANFLGNSAVTTGDYDATLNAIRTDI